MKYELWDLETGNYMETVDGEAERDLAIEGYVEANGESEREWIGVRPINEAGEWQWPSRTTSGA